MLPEYGLVLSLILLILGSLGLPVGMPPGAEDPQLAKVAPADAVAYLTWAGKGTSDPKSQNSTEKLLADPETARLKEFAAKAFAAGLKGGRPEGAEALAKVADLAERLAAKPGAIFVESVSLAAGTSPAIKAAIVSRQGTDAAALEKQVAQWSQEHNHPLQALTLSDNGKAVGATQIKGPTGLISWVVVGDYFILAQGEGVLQGVVTRLRGTATPPFVAELARGAPTKRVSSRSYVNAAALQRLAGQIPAEAAQIQKVLGLDQLQAQYGVSGLDEQGFISRSWITHANPPGGILKHVAGPPVTVADLAVVPADATFALAVRAEPMKILDSFFALAEGPPQPRNDRARLEETLDKIKTGLGIDLKEDVLASLGTAWRLYSSPTDGAMVVPGLSLVGDVKDPARLKKALGNLRGLPQIEASKVGEVEVFSVSLGGGGPLQPTPTWAVVGDKVIVTASPVAVRSFLRRGADFQSLAGSAAVKQALTGGTPSAVAFVDMQQIVDTYGPLLPAGAGLLTRQLPGGPHDLGKFPAVEKLAVHMRPTIVTFTSSDKTWEWTSRQTLPGGDLNQGSAVAIGLLLPAVQAARNAARRAQTMNNFKLIGLALHTYHSTYGHFPPAYTTDKNGKPLHSWRTLLLPWVEQQDLYDKLRLDEPWDSEHNLPLLKGVQVEAYASAITQLPPGHTTVLGIGSKQGAFPPGGKGTKIDDIRDGTANTIMVVEANPSASVPWYKPVDFTPDEKDPKKGLTGLWAGGFIAEMSDGSVRFVSEAIDPKVLKALFTIAGGEVAEDF